MSAAAESLDGIADAHRRNWAIAAVLGGMALVVLDAAIVNMALPAMATALETAPAAAVQIVTAYQLGLLMTLLPAAALGECLGYRRVFTAGGVLFASASLACAFAPSFGWLVAARFVQGVGGAGIMSLGIALLRFAIPRHRLGAAIGWNVLTVALSSAAGPPLGALILSLASWPWLFLVNLPLGTCVLIAARALPRVPGKGGPLDLTGIAASACAFAMFVIGAGLIVAHPVGAIALISAALLLLSILTRRYSAGDAPLIPRDLLRLPSVRVSMIASILCFIGQATAWVAAPFHLQHAFGLSPAGTALCLLPWPLAVAVVGPWAGRWAETVPTACQCLVGGLLLAIGLGSAALADEIWTYALCMMLCGTGFGLFNVANNRNIFLSAPRERSAAAGGLQSVTRLAGQTLGAVLAALLFTLCPMHSAPSFGLAVAAAFMLAAGATSLMHAGRSRVALQ